MYCYTEFKIRYLNNLKLFSVGIKELIEPIVLWNKAVLEPRVSPTFAITYFCNHCNIRFENTSKYVVTLTLFSKNLNQRSLTPRWPLTPCLLRSHVWLYPRIIVSKSHYNTSMYVDTVINFANYHIHTHTTYILHTTDRMSDHSLLLNSVQARQKSWQVFALFLKHFRNWSFSNARWFYSKKCKIWKRNLYLTKNRFSRNEIWCAVVNHNDMYDICAKGFLDSYFCWPVIDKISFFMKLPQILHTPTIKIVVLKVGL